MRRAVYAGTFDPITAGHLSVIERSAALFDQVFVLIALNPDKHPLFSVEERLEMIREAVAPFPGVQAAAYPGFTVDFARAHRAVFLVRGVRSATDSEYEIALADANRELAPDVTTIFIPAHPMLSDISSSQLKALATQGADVSGLCSPGVARRLREKLAFYPSEESTYADL